MCRIQYDASPGVEAGERWRVRNRLRDQVNVIPRQSRRQGKGDRRRVFESEVQDVASAPCSIGLEGVSLAEKMLIRTFCRNGAGLHQSIAREIDAETQARAKAAISALAPVSSDQHQARPEFPVDDFSGPGVLGDESYRVDQGKKNPTGDTVVAGAVPGSPSETATILQKLRTTHCPRREAGAPSAEA